MCKFEIYNLRSFEIDMHVWNYHHTQDNESLSRVFSWPSDAFLIFISLISALILITFLIITLGFICSFYSFWSQGFCLENFLSLIWAFRTLNFIHSIALDSAYKLWYIGSAFYIDLMFIDVPLKLWLSYSWSANFVFFRFHVVHFIGHFRIILHNIISSVCEKIIFLPSHVGYNTGILILNSHPLLHCLQ